MTNWITGFPAAEQGLWDDTVKPLAGKGGAQFRDFAALCANVGGARIVVCVNGFTDTTNWSCSTPSLADSALSAPPTRNTTATANLPTLCSERWKAGAEPSSHV